MTVTNLTITVEEEVILWVKVFAAQHDTSVSRLVGELLREKVLEEETYRVAMMRYLASPPVELKASGAIRHARRSTAPGRRAGDFRRYE